ncbi:hypothetical protein WR25_16278 isoform B [Diploscapter pachys]|uniref:Uncharacterized protein n=1 Tax=Diploscapter pachys TaxID=2018661 RepID=A0A2A2L891_9BILA|nr:hypothetical protein WR25_16278 isoform B [Diploscapter pachys]
MNILIAFSLVFIALISIQQACAACGTCDIKNVVIQPKNPDSGVHAFDGNPVAGKNSEGCDTYTFSCTGTGANIGLNNDQLTVGDANSRVKQTVSERLS